MAYELPQSLLELIDIIGYEATAKLASTRGGYEIEIPKNITENCLLAQIIGVDAAKKMLEYYSHGSLFVAQGCFRGERGRKTLGLYLLEQGYSAAEVARKTDVSIRTVYGWKSECSFAESHPLLDIMEGNR